VQVRLTRRELEVLAYFARNAGTIMLHRQVLRNEVVAWRVLVNVSHRGRTTDINDEGDDNVQKSTLGHRGDRAGRATRCAGYRRGGWPG
jgi:hypothetical protein